MKALLTEYGYVVLALIVAGFAFFGFIFLLRRYGYYVPSFVGYMTGSYVGYGEDKNLTISDIEKEGLSEYQIEWYNELDKGFDMEFTTD